MTASVGGPTYNEMLDPASLPGAIERAGRASWADELNAANLYNITWRGGDGQVRHVCLPRELTGVDANIIVMLGKHFPSGSHKVGPAYSTLMEGELSGEIEPGASRIIGPSTGNFGIGVAYVARLKGYPATVVMPEGMSRERYERIRRYGGELDLTPGSESDVILVLERTETYKTDRNNKILAQFELLPNYRFHRFVTGRSALSVAQRYGDGRVAAFVSAAGSAGTLAAGDEIKQVFVDATVCVLEPKECSTLFNNGRGTHRIEGIGDKMVTLIHNVLTTDYVMLVHDDHCVIGLDLIERQAKRLEQLIAPGTRKISELTGLFGISGICNILGSIRLARHLGLSREHNIVTVATDGFDRYPSVLEDLKARYGSLESRTRECFESAFRNAPANEILDVRPREQKQRLFSYKYDVWSRFGYTASYLQAMQSQTFWDTEYSKIRSIDESLLALRRGLQNAC